MTVSDTSPRKVTMINSEARAREIAKARGHRDVDHIIICTDGERVPVWKFYVGASADEIEAVLPTPQESASE